MLVNILIFIFLATVSATNSLSLQEIQALSISICELIDNFYSKYSQNVDIIDFGGGQGELVDKIIENVNNSMTMTVQKIVNPKKWSKKLKNQSILLFNSFMDLMEFNEKDLMEMRFINPIRFLVYCQNASYLSISSLKTDLVIPPYYYFIIFDNDIKLYTFENLKSLKICHESQQLVLINNFSVKKLKWTKKPIFPKKYKSFHNCTMVLGNHGFSNLFKYYYYEHQKKTLTFGLVKDILSTTSKILNFRLFITLCYTMDCTKRLHKHLYVYNVFINPTLERYAIHKERNFAWRHVMLNVQCT